MKPKPISEIHHTAHHEAGHAIIAAVLGILGENSSITIVPKGFVQGSVEFSRDARNYAWRRWGVRYIHKAILATYAGPAVSIKLEPGLNLFEEGGWNEFDMVGAADFCAWIGDPVFSCCEPYANNLVRKSRNWKKAVSLVELNWPVIKAVAAELVERRTMTGAEVKAMLKASSRSARRFASSRQ